MVLSPHWRDPMQYVFATSYYVTKITTALMRYGGIAFVMLGMSTNRRTWFLDDEIDNILL